MNFVKLINYIYIHAKKYYSILLLLQLLNCHHHQRDKMLKKKNKKTFFGLCFYPDLSLQWFLGQVSVYCELVRKILHKSVLHFIFVLLNKFFTLDFSPWSKFPTNILEIFFLFSWNRFHDFLKKKNLDTWRPSNLVTILYSFGSFSLMQIMEKGGCFVLWL